jgi:hypothetical protein
LRECSLKLGVAEQTKIQLGRSKYLHQCLNNPTLHEDHSCLHSPRFCIIHGTFLDVSREHATDSIRDSPKEYPIEPQISKKASLRKPFAAHSGAIENLLSVMYSLDSPVYSTAPKSASLAEFRALSWSHHRGPRNHASKNFCFWWSQGDSPLV